MSQEHTGISRIQWTIRGTIGFFVLAISLHAMGADGLTIKRADGSVEYFGNNAVCTTSPEGTYSVIKDNKILMVFKATGKYWLGTAKDWCKEMKKMMEGSEDISHAAPATYTLKKQGVETVAGRPATHYSIMMDGEAVHDIWINQEPQVAGKIQKMEKTMNYMDCAKSEGMFEINGMDLQPAVMELEKKGLVVKRQDPNPNPDNPYISESVTSIKLGPIPANKLSLTPPAGMKAAPTIMSLFKRM